MIVFSLWAMVRTVHSWNLSRIVCWMSPSVLKKQETKHLRTEKLSSYTALGRDFTQHRTMAHQQRNMCSNRQKKYRIPQDFSFKKTSVVYFVTFFFNWLDLIFTRWDLDLKTHIFLLCVLNKKNLCLHRCFTKKILRKKRKSFILCT